ncbi:MAG: hypothetical protein BWY71_00414 [Planctomycetes bacterium ADurb.Bin412]|nr:MAG: hypothetical protein BWY71_00414 [Planctomycetes bacterium ADurb.Bin412]
MDRTRVYLGIWAAGLVIAAGAGGCHKVHQCPYLQGITGWNIPSPLPPEGQTYKVVGYREGIRFYVIEYNEKMYRAGDIRSAKGAEALQQLGIKTVISASPNKNQRAWAEQCGMKFVEIPFGWYDMTSEDLHKFLQVVDASPKPICVCSRSGMLRAGILLAHYRIHREGWDVEAALEEYYKLDANYGESKKLVKVLRENAPQEGNDDAQNVP